MGEDWEDFLASITEREAKANGGTRSLCRRCSQFKVNPPRKVCWKCRERERLTVKRRRQKASLGLCLAHRCMSASMPGYSHCINHRGRRVMSDRDAGHTLLELQEARAEVDRLRELVRWRKWPEEKPEKEGDYFCIDSGRCFVGGFLNNSWLESYGTDALLTEVAYWRPIGPLPGGEA